MKSLQPVADLGVPYPVLLYERFLGRPFASHRDSVSELVGEVVEAAVKDVLTEARVSFRETKRAERITGFDQAPDFIIPDEFNPVALIEAKLTEDDGTARDKVSRVQRLRTLRDQTGHTHAVAKEVQHLVFFTILCTRSAIEHRLQHKEPRVPHL
jgi:hypothetical protein